MSRSASVPNPTARAAVTARVAERARQYPDLGPMEWASQPVDPVERRLARAIDMAVSRRWLTLRTVMKGVLERPWETLDPPVEAALLVGAAQLLLFDRIPDHAAINEAVAWVKSRGGMSARRTHGAAGVVNAVLRRVAALRGETRAMTDGTGLARNVLPLADGRLVTLGIDVFAPDPVERLAQQTSHPIWLIRRWHDCFGAKRTIAIALHDMLAAPVLISGPGVAELRRERRLDAHLDGATGVLPHRATLDDLLADDVWVQDPGTAASVAMTSTLRPKLIIETCAGFGTKTRQLATLHPDARVISTDKSVRRRKVLAETVADWERIEVVEPTQLIEWVGRADLLVIDPPCSNTGVLARRPEARYRHSEAGMATLLDLQRQILADAMRCLAPGGHLLYATCSLEPEENHGQVEWLERWHRLRLDVEETRWPTGSPGEAPKSYRDGGYSAICRKPDG